MAALMVAVTGCGANRDEVRVAAEAQTRTSVAEVAARFSEVLSRRSITNGGAAVKALRADRTSWRAGGGPIWFILTAEARGENVQMDVAVYGHARGTDDTGNPFRHEYVEQCLRLNGTVNDDVSSAYAPVVIPCAPVPASEQGVPRRSLVVATLAA